MGEPRVEDIGDYNSLKGEKRKVVFAVIFAGLIMGVIYTITYRVYDNKEDTLKVKGNIDTLPNKIINKNFN